VRVLKIVLCLQVVAKPGPEPQGKAGFLLILSRIDKYNSQIGTVKPKIELGLKRKFSYFRQTFFFVLVAKIVGKHISRGCIL
jgi:hypothetical protein